MPTERSTVQEMAARRYIEKREAYAREISARNGVPYGSETVSEDRGYELFHRKAPQAQLDPDYEQKMWLEASSAVAAGRLEPSKVASYVVGKVFPDRIPVTEADGRLTLEARASYAERMAARRKRAEQDTGPDPALTPLGGTSGPAPTEEASYG